MARNSGHSEPATLSAGRVFPATMCVRGSFSRPKSRAAVCLPNVQLAEVPPMPDCDQSLRSLRKVFRDRWIATITAIAEKLFRDRSDYWKQHAANGKAEMFQSDW